MKHIKHWVKSLRFRNKIIVVCIISGIIPVLLLGGFSYYLLQQQLRSRDREQLQSTVRQISMSLEYKSQSYIDMANHLIYNSRLIEAFSSHYENNFEMYLAYKYIIDPAIFAVSVIHPDINAVRIFTNINIHPRGRYVLPLSYMKEYFWYEDALLARTVQFSFSTEKETAFVYSLIPTRNPDLTSVLLFEISYDSFFSSLTQLYEENYTIFVTDGTETAVFSHSYGRDEVSILLLDIADGAQVNYILEYERTNTPGLSVYALRPAWAAGYAVNLTAGMIVAFAGFCILFLLLSTYTFSKLLVRPLEKLSENMHNVETDGDFTITISNDSDDEVGLLIQSFRSMIKRIEDTIDEVYKSKIKQQQFEMMALQSQINPHFFYNSLSSINSIAIVNNQNEISLIAQYLATYYRTTLNKGSSFITLRDEWANMCAYVQIQKIVKHNSFDFYEKLDFELEEIIVPNLIIQPLVENAILHGLDYCEKGIGVLNVTTHVKNQTLIITVSDNGQGMAKKEIDALLTKRSKGYGVYNVHQRIRLQYGEEYGLKITSAFGEGTTVQIIIPVNEAEH